MAKRSQSRGWLLTLPERFYKREDVETGLCGYTGYVGQLEEGGKTGYRHWQVYVENQSPIRFTTLRNKFPKGHFEPRRGSKKQAYEYVTKTDTSAGEVLQGGEIDLENHQGKRTDLAAFHQLVMEGVSVEAILCSEPGALRYGNHLDRLAAARDHLRLGDAEREVRCAYLWGPPGCGKTSRVLAECRQAGLSAFRVVDYQHPFDGYRGEDVLVLDDYSGGLGISLLLSVLDRYPLRLPARYQDRVALFTRVYVIANIALENQYVGFGISKAQEAALKRRFEVVEKMAATSQTSQEGLEPAPLLRPLVNDQKGG